MTECLTCETKFVVDPAWCPVCGGEEWCHSSPLRTPPPKEGLEELFIGISEAREEQ